MKASWWCIFSDVLSTIVGSGIAVLSTIIPLIVVMSDNPSDVKIASIVGGNLGGGITGAAIARYQPRALASIIKRHFELEDEVELEEES